MIKIKYIIRYFALNYPYKHELSKARLTKMVYLADWFSAQKNGKQLTKINWFFDHYGPYVPDVFEVATSDKTLEIREGYTAFGTPKQTIYLREENSSKLKLNRISDLDKRVLDEVIAKTKHLNWSEFIDYVYNTYPIRSQKRYSFLNLNELASEKEEAL